MDGESGPPPVVRGLAALRIHRRFYTAPLHCFREVAQAHGSLCTVATPFRAGRRRVHFALGARANERVLRDLETFRTSGQGLSGPRGSVLRRVRNGLTRTRGEKHRRVRALFMPSLQRRAVAAAAPHVASIVDEQLAGWCSGDAVDLGAEMRAISLRVSSEVLFGIRDRARAAALGVLLRDFVRRSFSPAVLATRVYGRVPGSPYEQLHRHAERIEAAVGELIADRRRGPLGDDVVSALVRARDEGVPWLDEEDLVGQITLLFGASFETTAQALTWSLILLAQHPASAKQLRDELLGAGALDFDTLDALPTLDGAIREALRLFPPVPYTLRIATRDAPLLEASVRRGDRILCSHFDTHRAPSVFPDPQRFEPLRWRTARPGPFEYFPFSAPPRICIGEVFAQGVLKRALAEVVRRHDFGLRDGARIDALARVTLGPRQPVALELAPPHGAFRRARVSGDFCRFVDAPG